MPNRQFGRGEVTDRICTAEEYRQAEKLASLWRAYKHDFVPFQHEDSTDASSCSRCWYSRHNQVHTDWRRSTMEVDNATSKV